MTKITCPPPLSKTVGSRSDFELYCLRQGFAPHPKSVYTVLDKSFKLSYSAIPGANSSKFSSSMQNTPKDFLGAFRAPIRNLLYCLRQHRDPLPNSSYTVLDNIENHCLRQGGGAGITALAVCVRA